MSYNEQLPPESIKYSISNKPTEKLLLVGPYLLLVTACFWSRARLNNNIWYSYKCAANENYAIGGVQNMVLVFL